MVPLGTNSLDAAECRKRLLAEGRFHRGAVDALIHALQDARQIMDARAGIPNFP